MCKLPNALYRRQTGTRARARANGWTLFELVVVLVIIGAALALGLPRLRMPSAPERPEIVRFLDQARAHALRTGKTARIRLNVDRLSDSLRQTSLPIRLPAVDRPGVEENGDLLTLFYPDGTFTAFAMRAISGGDLLTVSGTPFNSDFEYRYESHE